MSEESDKKVNDWGQERRAEKAENQRRYDVSVAQEDRRARATEDHTEAYREANELGVAVYERIASALEAIAAAISKEKP